LPAAFDDWMLRCINRDPRARFASAGAAVEALSRIEPAAQPERAPTGPKTPVSERTETVGNAVGIAAFTPGSVPTLTTALPEPARTTKPRRGLVGIAVAAGLSTLTLALWLGLDTNGAPARIPEAPKAPAASAQQDDVALSPEPPQPLPAVSQSDNVAEPSQSSPKPRAPAPSRAKRAVSTPAPALSERANATSPARPLPIFVELPRAAPSQQPALGK
jgi:serine/threonine-protein kinase